MLTTHTDAVKWREIYEQMGGVNGGYWGAAKVVEGAALTAAGVGIGNPGLIVIFGNICTDLPLD